MTITTSQRAGSPVSREPESGAMSTLLTRLATEPAGLVVTGEAGIGKTTLWLDGCEAARASGIRVLSARGDPSEVRLTFAALADLLGDVDDAVIDLLPPVQRSALNRILLRGNEGPATDEHAAAAAFRAVVEHLATETPVLIAIDDVQWLDASSATAVRFAARRLTGRVGVLITARTGEPDTADPVSWLQLDHPDAVTRLRMSPLTLGGAHALISERLGRVLPRPTMVRIYEVSGGNPLYAVELARAIADGRGIDRELPDTLAALVRARVEGVDAETRQLLLAAACTPDATVESVAAATHTSAVRVVELLESGDAARIVTITGNRLRFAHPLLATGVYTGADPARRREMHRRLADCVDAPELKARHLASAAVSGDAATLDALDAAASVARSQGAPAAAAELVELAMSLGGDTPQRRIQAAEHHFRAGSLGPARDLLQPTVDTLPPGAMRCLALMLFGAILGYAEDVPAAVKAFTQAADEAEDDALRLHCLLRVVFATVMTGRIDQALECTKTAVALADRLGIPDLRSRTLSISVVVKFVAGLGVDDSELQTAVQLEDPNGDATTWYLASAVQAMVSAWTGNLLEARSQMSAVHDRMVNGGTEIDIIWAANHLATIDVWLGRYADAGRASRDAVQRAEQMGGRQLLVTAWGWQAKVAAYTGREDEARTAATAAIDAATASGAHHLVQAATATLALLEVSLGNYVAAVNVLEPILASFQPNDSTEIDGGMFLPDAIEALTGLGRVDEAEFLVKALYDNGTRLDRAWMLAMAARGQALCLAARGDLTGAAEAAVAAMTQHDRLPMPFERARTQLLLGQLQRRRRHKAAAAATLREALDTFDSIGTPLWSERASDELTRLGSTSDRPRSGLTPAELRIAQRAAAGLSNKEIAAEQFLALKTVEMTLSSAYRKLGIRSRAQLHGRLDDDVSRGNPDSGSAERR